MKWSPGGGASHVMALVLMIAGLLVGCGQSGIAGGGTTPAAPPTATQQAPAAATTAASLAATTAVSPATTPAGDAGGATGAPLTGAQVKLVEVVSGLEQPVDMTNAGDGSGRLFVVEKAGRIRIIKNGQIAPQPFLDITDRVGSQGSEQGLLSVAFHPAYRQNGRFFVDYTDVKGDTSVEEYHVAATPDTGNAASARLVLHIAQPYPNHNGGQLAFGPDGYLYIGMGDGGSAGDPHGNGQNRNALLGKILRIDVDGAPPYAIPPTNPFRATAGTRPEIWAYGLRNPWRFSFDRQTGDLWIGDVGQDKREEIDLQPAKSPGGQNYGWNRMEGLQCFKPASGCDRTGLQLPVIDYGHGEGCSITGGMRSRAPKSALAGLYIFGDYCSGRIWTLRQQPGGGWERTELLNTGKSISSFGEDEQGNIYVCDIGGGTLFRLDG